MKIMFVHVPNAWLSMFVWGVMSMASLGTLVWRHPLADVAAKSAAPIGAALTFLALLTDSLWGRPMWGTYWDGYVRHPQYIGFILVMFGFLLQWPTILTLAMFPVLTVMYVRLARSEEKDARAQFGIAYDKYAAEVPGFFEAEPIARSANHRGVSPWLAGGPLPLSSSRRSRWSRRRAVMPLRPRQTYGKRREDCLSISE